MSESTITPARVLYRLLCPLLRAEDIAIIEGVHPATMRRHLQRLEQRGLVEKVEPGTIANSQGAYYLTQAGLEAVARGLGVEPQSLARRRGVEEASILRLLPRLTTLIATQNFIRYLALQAPDMLSYTNGQRADVGFHWQRDWHHAFQWRGHAARVTADAAIAFGRKKRREQEPESFFPIFLLADAGLSGSTDHLIIERQLEQLLRYRESTERTPYYAQFPPVVVIVPTPHQREHWQRIAIAVASDLRVDPLAGVIACVPPDQAEIPAWRLPWQGLSNHTPARLQDYLVSVTEEALPDGFLPKREAPEPDSKPRNPSKTVLVRGHYAERARNYERGNREEVAWLGIQLSHRQKTLLNMLYAAPLLSTQDIAALFAMNVSTASRALYDLQQAGCIERETTGAGKRWRLSILGLRLIAAMLHVPMQHVAERESETLVQRGLDMLRRNIQHTAGVYAFVALLHRTAAGEAGHKITWWESGAWCERRYRDHNGWRNLRPDAALEYRTDAQRVRLWLEWDRGQMTSGALERKFFAYAHYVHSREWARELRPLPTLLVVTPDPGNEARIERIARPCVEGGLIVRTTTTSRLEQQGPLAMIWLTTLAGRQQPQRQSWLTATSAEGPVAVSNQVAGAYATKG
jgi:DNA-binding MarR family transcriptional regulator